MPQRSPDPRWDQVHLRQHRSSHARRPGPAHVPLPGPFVAWGGAWGLGGVRTRWGPLVVSRVIRTLSWVLSLLNWVITRASLVSGPQPVLEGTLGLLKGLENLSIFSVHK